MKLPVLLVRIINRASEEMNAGELIDTSFFSNSDFTQEELEDTEYMLDKLTNHLENIILMNSEEIYDTLYYIYEDELVLHELENNGGLI